MHTSITILYDTTMKLVSYIDSTETEQLLNLIELRENVIRALGAQDNLSTEERDILREIVRFDDLIASRMMVLKDETANKLNNLKRTKVQKNKYEQAYISESYFIDKKN